MPPFTNAMAAVSFVEREYDITKEMKQPRWNMTPQGTGAMGQKLDSDEVRALIV